ncbi:hypothetical protein YC2023_002778 [Brassica napus]
MKKVRNHCHGLQEWYSSGLRLKKITKASISDPCSPSQHHRENPRHLQDHGGMLCRQRVERGD